ncbi:MAG: tyrosine-type recombinase/integrase [Saprospiraceae bacterium]|jgi:integrase/recombinase XerC|nr:tyrosine-type recombinase/integrase [Candidatus Brachybacter algidus]MBP7307179.1 tyrosine-type recombinase/integrase [Saprospiraceae bacterium]MBK8843636.1 tyrosine-type recombinase/integrase [Candidatus Brachybacter algidus]MBK9024944.1 tyrosine-type recombinase/integrase [Candidatus Brachybacter algidus]MBK9552730.1 tyrosine-type recombinase/integrase [Candidatus Brachybacter algidus]
MRNELERFYNYISSVERYSQNTRQSYQNDIDGFASFILVTYQISQLTEATHFHIRSWIVTLMEINSSSHTIHRKISALSTFYKYLRRFEGLGIDPMAKVIRPKANKRLPVTVPKDELSYDQILGTAEPDGYSNAMARLMILFLYTTGIRRSELININEADIDFSRMILKVTGKGKKERFVPISSDLVIETEKFKLLKKSSLPMGEENLLFLTLHGKPVYPKLVYNVVNSFLKTIPNLERKSPHILRHSFATHLSDAGADINAIKMLLGHSSLASTQVYMHNAPQRLKSIYSKAHPRAEKEL